MTKQEHKMLVEIHGKVKDLPTKANLNEATRTVIRRVTHVIKAVDKPNAPTNETRKRQVQKVRELMDRAYREGRKLSLNQACLEIWEPLMDGYPTPRALYNYCHEHEHEW